jgi:hypothetical protein
MSVLLNNWAMVNTIVIMLALGMAYRPTAGQLHVAVITRSAIGYNFVLPALGLMLLASFTAWFSAETLTALSLCIAAAGGTSAGAFVKKSGASATFTTALTATLLIVLLGLSLGVIGTLSLTALCGYLLLITLVPFWLGILLTWLWPLMSNLWQPRLDRTGSIMVLLLIAALAWRYGAEILSGPTEPLWAAALLVTLLVLPPLLLERQPELRRTLVLTTLIRNLTLALSLLVITPNAGQLLPTVLAFGLLMYLLSGVLLLLL